MMKRTDMRRRPVPRAQQWRLLEKPKNHRGETPRSPGVAHDPYKGRKAPIGAHEAPGRLASARGFVFL